MWNSFWNNTFSGNIEPDRISLTSDSRNAISTSAGHRGKFDLAQSPDHSIRESMASRQLFNHDGPFSFKLKDLAPTGTGKIYRFSCPTNSLAVLYENVCQKTGYSTVLSMFEDVMPEVLDITTTSGATVRLYYVDDEGDFIILESDKDLQEAVSVAYSLNLSRLVIYLGDPSNHVPVVEAQVFQSRASSASSGVYKSYEMSNPLVATAPQDALFSTLKDAPLAVNVAISAGIIVAAYWIMRKIS